MRVNEASDVQGIGDREGERKRALGGGRSESGSRSDSAQPSSRAENAPSATPPWWSLFSADVTPPLRAYPERARARLLGPPAGVSADASAVLGVGEGLGVANSGAQGPLAVYPPA